MSTTQQGPMTVNDVINRLKLLPGEWRLEIHTSDGVRYIESINVSDNCEVELVLLPLPDLEIP